MGCIGYVTIPSLNTILQKSEPLSEQLLHHHQAEVWLFAVKLTGNALYANVIRVNSEWIVADSYIGHDRASRRLRLISPHKSASIRRRQLSRTSHFPRTDQARLTDPARFTNYFPTKCRASFSFSLQMNSISSVSGISSGCNSAVHGFV
jgi:hypothetical protein